jgi:hypothetical protein
MYTYVLNERVVSDDTLSIPEKGKVFKGGYIAIVQQNEFANAWQDNLLKPVKFRSKERLFKYLDKHYPEFEVDFSGTCLE